MSQPSPSLEHYLIEDNTVENPMSQASQNLKQFSLGCHATENMESQAGELCRLGGKKRLVRSPGEGCASR